ncbi:MAG: hypothetical protein WCT41_01395 [Candidatus Paceibacterota bacterium]|jgi:hypothetical protein
MSIVSLVKLVIWVLILLLALSFFGISIQAIVSSPTGQANFNYIFSILQQLWQWATFWIRPSA